MFIHYKTVFPKDIFEYIKIQFISIFLDISKFADFQRKNVDVSRTQGVCYMIYIFFGFFLGKV